MRQIVDRSTFDEISATCMRVYLAIQSSNLLAEEADCLQTRVDRFLRAAGIAYLTESLPGLASQPAETPAASECAEAFVQVQRLSAELHNELKQLSERKIKSGELDSAAALLQAEGVTPTDLPPLEALIHQAAHHFNVKQWKQGRALLKPFVANTRIRMTYYRSFFDALRQSQSMAATTSILEELAEQVPSKIMTPRERWGYISAYQSTELEALSKRVEEHALKQAPE